jgi:hypothetical protein
MEGVDVAAGVTVGKVEAIGDGAGEGVGAMIVKIPSVESFP